MCALFHSGWGTISGRYLLPLSEYHCLCASLEEGPLGGPAQVEYDDGILYHTLEPLVLRWAVSKVDHEIYFIDLKGVIVRSTSVLQFV